MVVGQRHSHVECLLRVRACGWLHARWCNERESQVCDPNPYAATRQVRLPPGGAHVYHDLCHEYLTRKPIGSSRLHKRNTILYHEGQNISKMRSFVDTASIDSYLFSILNINASVNVTRRQKSTGTDTLATGPISWCKRVLVSAPTVLTVAMIVDVHLQLPYSRSVLHPSIWRQLSDQAEVD